MHVFTYGVTMRVESGLSACMLAVVAVHKSVIVHGARRIGKQTRRSICGQRPLLHGTSLTTHYGRVMRESNVVSRSSVLTLPFSLICTSQPKHS